MIAAAILTVSDSAHRGTRADRSGPALQHRIQELGWQIVAAEVVPDERSLIAGRLAALADTGGIHAIFTTGGTGVALRDVTPEATREVIEREIPGIAELMRAIGRQSTRFAPLSRAIAGMRGTVLIVNLPGSPQGALESLNAIVDLVPHIVDLAGGRTEHPQPCDDP